MNKENLLGLPFGRWLVIAPAPSSGTGQGRWLCRCDCGNERSVSASTLARGRSMSCGCFSAEVTRERMLTTGSTRTHGHASGRNRRGSRQGSPTYTSWRGARDRCLNPKMHAYSDYGGRGITICERWSSFENFLTDMGERPAGLSLDRIDPNGNYEPGNCRWADKLVQRNNHRLSAPRVAEILAGLKAASSDLLERAIIDRVRSALLGR